MARALIFSDRADRDLVRLKRFLDRESAGAAAEAAARIISGVDLLLMFPLSGVALKGKTRRLVLRHGKSAYIVHYQIKPDAILITRVWHSKEQR